MLARQHPAARPPGPAGAGDLLCRRAGRFRGARAAADRGGGAVRRRAVPRLRRLLRMRAVRRGLRGRRDRPGDARYGGRARRRGDHRGHRLQALRCQADPRVRLRQVPERVHGASRWSASSTPPARPRARSCCAPAERPRTVGIIHCVGSRDARYNAYCSRVCCMYSLKLAHLIKEHTGAEVYNFYIDMRTPGKGYEEFYEKVLKEGVHLIRGRVAEVTDWATRPRRRASSSSARRTRWPAPCGGSRWTWSCSRSALEPQADAEHVGAAVQHQLRLARASSPSGTRSSPPCPRSPTASSSPAPARARRTSRTPWPRPARPRRRPWR